MCVILLLLCENDTDYLNKLKSHFQIVENLKSSTMKAKHHVHNLIILDESSSMGSIKTTILNGFNEIVQTIQEGAGQFSDQEHFISFISFNSNGNKIFHFVELTSHLKKLNHHNYHPSAMTPLFDAMGHGINKLRKHLKDKTNYNVLVTILTDGEENASKVFSGNDIKKLVEELRENNWTFTYIGTDHDVERISDSLSIDNRMTFDKNQDGIDFMFVTDRNARINYYEKIHRKEDTKSNYFEAEKPKERNSSIIKTMKDIFGE